MYLDEEDTFENVIWSDESSVQLTLHAQTMRVKTGRDCVLKPQAKHALKVHVCAAISRRVAHASACLIMYVSILEEFLCPF